KASRVIVPDDKLSLAIGKGGQNVRLAARLTGWKIDVKPESSQEIEAESDIPEYEITEVKDDEDIFAGLEEISGNSPIEE
ncbi:MAG: KH domain-containing protein, partial [Clostridia bacterium]